MIVYICPVRDTTLVASPISNESASRRDATTKSIPIKWSWKWHGDSTTRMVLAIISGMYRPYGTKYIRGKPHCYQCFWPYGPEKMLGKLPSKSTSTTAPITCFILPVPAFCFVFCLSINLYLIYILIIYHSWLEPLQKFQQFH